MFRNIERIEKVIRSEKFCDYCNKHVDEYNHVYAHIPPKVVDNILVEPHKDLHYCNTTCMINYCANQPPF